MSNVFNATARIESDGAAILVFHGSADGASAEAYSRKDGHVQVTRGYYTTHTTPPRGADDEAQVSRLVEHYNSLPGDGTVRLVSRMNWRAA